ncbi:MAG: M56 family metallopeptidase [Vicinamibacteria bacterium]
MPELLAEPLLHGLVAAVVVAALLRVWRLAEPGQRLAFQLLGLACPLLLPPLYALSDGGPPPRLRDAHALYAHQRLASLRLAGAGADLVVLGGLALAGTALFARDLVPLLLDPLRRRALRLQEPSGADAGLVEEVALLAGCLRAPTPALRIVESPAPLLFCRGLLRPAIVVSRGLLDDFDAQERRAALAHEVAHAASRDPLLGWALLVVRALQPWNPGVQLLARAALSEIERRADDRAVAVTGQPLALAAGLVKAYRRGHGARAQDWPVPGLDGAVGVWQRLHAEALAARCRRLLDPTGATGLARPALHLAATAAGLAGLLFFVV